MEKSAEVDEGAAKKLKKDEEFKTIPIPKGNTQTPSAPGTGGPGTMPKLRPGPKMSLIEKGKANPSSVSKPIPSHSKLIC